jgi:hypothetical protein
VLPVQVGQSFPPRPVCACCQHSTHERSRLRCNLQTAASSDYTHPGRMELVVGLQSVLLSCATSELSRASSAPSGVPPSSRPYYTAASALVVLAGRPTGAYPTVSTSTVQYQCPAVESHSVRCAAVQSLTCAVVPPFLTLWSVSAAAQWKYTQCLALKALWTSSHKVRPAAVLNLLDGVVALLAGHRVV